MEAELPGYFWILITSILVLGCQSKVEKVLSSHPNGFQEKVHVYESENLVEIKTFHMNNIRATSTEIQDGKSHGEFQRWNTKGTLVEEGEFREGLRTGTWTEYLSRTEVLSRGDYKNGLKNGVWKKYWPQGTIKSEAHWENGKQIGLEQTWFFDGTLKSKHNCFDYGTYEEFYHNGKTKILYECTPGKLKNGFYRHYDLLSHLLEEFHYITVDKTELKDSTWIWMNAKGDTLQVRNYSNGLLNGTQRVGDKTFEFKMGTGTLQDSNGIDSTWRMGKLDGEIQTIDEKGFLVVENWVLGKKQNAKRYRLAEDGSKTLVASGPYKNNLRHGDWTVWHPNGKISQKLHYEEDLYMGDQIYHDTLGRATMVKTFFGKGQKVLVKILKPE